MKNFSLAVLGTILWMTAAAGLVHAASTDLEKDLVKALYGSRTVAEQGATALKKGGSGRSDSAQLKKYAEEVAALDLLQRERFRVQGEKVAALGGKARARHEAMVSRYQVAMDRLLPLLQQTTSGPAANNLSTWQELQKLLDSILPPSQPPLHGTLPYRHLNATTQLPTISPLMTPAYRTAAAITASDLEATPEAPRSAAIVDLAQSLSWSPAAIYQWVTDNIATEWYWGAMKGAEETLQQRSGNDADQAALLVALLRASGYPTRYVRGVIEFYPQDLVRVANQTGVQDPARLGDFFQKAGIPYTPTLSGSTVVNYQIEHLWVETYVPYANYRGVLADVQGKIWLPLDSSIKVAGYDSTVGALDLFNEVGSPLATLREDYLSSFIPESPLEFLRTRSQAFLDQNHPGEAYATLLNQRSQRASTLNILPASLQFREVAVTGEYTRLPATLLHQLRFFVPGVGEPVLDVTLDLYTLSNRKVVISYEPESVEDQEIINSWGGLDNTPAYLVRLRPVLLVDGERLAVGQEGFANGAAYSLTLELTSPAGGTTFSNELICGYPAVLGVAAQKALVPAPEAVKNEAIDLLHRDALTYIDNWNQAENELAALLRTPIVRPLPTVIMLGGALEVTTLLGEPQGVEWKGLFIDADLRFAEVLGTGAAATERERLFMELSALQGSVLENQIFETALNVESISTAKLLGLAADAQIPLLTLDATNIESELPTLTLADNVRTDIVAAVGAGLTVRLPRFALTYHNWNGVGYIKENPATGEAGYMLAGIIAGGATVLGVEMWPEETRAVMIAPYQGESNLDPNQANSITAVLPNAVKMASVGTETTSPLMVLVRDAANLPVSWAPVVFSVRSGGGLLLDTAATPHVWGATITVLSGPDGIARARFKPGNSTSINPLSYTRSGDSYANIVGQNLIDAQLGCGTAASLRSPLAVLGFAAAPDVAGSIYYGNGNGGDIFGSSGSAVIFLKDQYGNPVANHPVTFTALNAEPESSSQCNDLGAFAAERIKAQLIDQRETCLASNPVWGECPAAGSSLALVSLSDGGAGVDVVLGAVPYAKYPVQASYAGSSGAVTQTVRHRSNALGSCFSTEAPSNKVIVTYLGHVDEFSVNVDARPAGVPATLKVKNYLLSEGGRVQSAGVILSCGETTLNCGRVVGDGVFSVTDPASLRLTVNGTSAQHLADFGLFEAQVNLPLGLNTLALAGTAEKPLLKIDNSCPSCGIPYTANTAIGPTTRTAQIWGVKLGTPQTFQVAVDGNGYLTENTDFAYTILPAAYRANMAQMLLYRNGELIFVAATDKSGTPSVTFPSGFWFDRNSGYYIEVLLNNLGDADQILSERIPVTFADVTNFGGDFMVERVHLVSEFDAMVPANINSPYLDSFQVFPVTLAAPATVKVSVLDADYRVRGTLVAEALLEAGEHNFVVDFEHLRSNGFSPAGAPTFYVLVESRAQASSALTNTLYPGRLGERTTSAKMLGQTMVHDVLIQDGSLNLSRQDLALKGRGPLLEFARSYNNQQSPAGFKPLGGGWSHNLDLRLQVLSTSANGVSPVPTWVDNLDGAFFVSSAIPQEIPLATVVQVNGTLFKKYNGTWYAERGKHGRLSEISGGYLFTAKDGTRYRYDHPYGSNWLVSAIDDRNGNRQSFTYNELGQLTKVTDAVGRELIFTYELKSGFHDDNPHRLTQVTGPDGLVLNFTYNADGYLRSVQRGERVETYEYSREVGVPFGEFNLAKATDSSHHSFAYSYAAPGAISSNLTTFVKYFRSRDMIKQVTYPDGTAAGFTYDVATGNKRIVTDLRGNPTTYTLNFVGNPTKIEEPLGKTTSMTWSINEGLPDNVMTSRTDPRNNKTTYEYDTSGNVTRETDPYNRSIVTIWNQSYSLPEQRTDRNNVIQRWNYNPANGNLNWHEDSDLKRTNYSFFATGEVQSATDPRLNSTTFTYDTHGNPNTVTGPEGSVSDFDYDLRGRKVAETDPNTNRTVYTYDVLDYPASVTAPALTAYALPAGSSNVKTTDYDALGNLLAETDRVGLTLTYTYTPRNQVETISRNVGGAKTFGYDANGNLTRETDWKGIATSHTYNSLNRRDTTTNRLADGMSMDYDLNGNLTQTTDYAGRVTDYEYDKLNRQTKTIQPLLPGQGARGEIVQTYYFEADPKGNLKTVTDAEGHVTQFEYNGRYQKKKQTSALGELDYVHEWLYDDAGNLEQEIDAELNVTRYSYDRQNRRRVAYKTDAGREFAVEERQYDLAGNIRFVLDAGGNSTETVYDQWNRPWQSITPLDVHAGVKYTRVSERDGEGREVKATDGNGQLRTSLRDPRGLVITATDAENQPTTYTYDLNGNVETITNARSYLTRVGYDAEDRKLLTTEAEGTPEQRISGVLPVGGYDKVGNPLQVRDGNGNIVVTEYNALNLPWKRFDPAPFSANMVEILYDRNSKPVSVKNRRGFVTTTAYDALGRVDTVTDPAPFANQTIVTTYDKVGHVKTVKDKRDIVTENFYDDLYRLTEQRRAEVRLISIEYDDAGNKTATVDAESHRVEYAYNSRNLPERTTFVDGVDNFYAEQFYDGVGNVVSAFNEVRQETVTTFDNENRKRTVTFAGETSENVYDEVGNLTTAYKPKRNSRVMSYDGLNRLTSVVEGGLETAYTYDDNNNQLRQTDPLGHEVAYTYDALNRKKVHIQHKPAGDLTVAFDSYDAGGNLTQLTDAKGQVFGFEYDELNRQTLASYPNVATPYLTPLSVATTYDANNNVVTVTETKAQSGGGTITDVTTNIWDDFDRLDSSTQRGVLLDYGYDNNGNRTSVSTANGSTTYTFDSRNRLKTAVVGAETTTYAYTPTGQTASISYPNGTRASYNYWPSNRVETITHKAGETVISSFAYTYDDNGNRTEQIETQGAITETTDYGYDSLDRMENFTLTSGADTTVTAYTFEGYNRKTENVTVNGTPTVNKPYSYDESNWLTSVEDNVDPVSVRTVSYQYDNNGNTVRKSATGSDDVLFVYDSRNQLVETTQVAMFLGRYDYNAQGLRVRHYGSERGDIDYFYDDGAVLEERTAAGGLLAHYRYADRLLSLQTGSETQYYHHDALGSTVDLTDGTGSVKVRYTLDPWGHIRSQVGSSVNRMIFTGQEYDEQTGLIYFGARYYDPDTARFLTQDSYLGEVGTPPSLHRYLYAYANPTVYVDLMGYASVPPVTGVFYPETDVMSGWNPTIDTGVQLADDALAAVVGIGNLVPAAVNSASFASTTPLMAYAGVTGQTLEEANGEFLNMSMTVPYLGKAAQFLRGGTGLRSLLSAASKTVTTVTKEAKDGLKAFGTASIEIEGLGSNLGNLKLRRQNAKIAEEVAEEVTEAGVKTSPAELAKGFQGSRDYPGVDNYRDITLKKGTTIYAGEPGVTGFFTTSSAVRRTGLDATALFKGLQVSPRNGLYRPGVTAFEVLEDTPAAFGIARKNTKYGDGGLPQLFIPNHNEVVRPVISYPLKNRIIGGE